MIALENLSKSFVMKGNQLRPILSNVSLDIPDGNLAVLGRNGMGKSTLLRMIAGIERPDSGRIIRRRAISWPIGFRGGFHRQLTGRENVRFVARVYGQNTEYVSDFVEAFAELGAFFDQPVASYSTGMAGRLAFGLSMAVKFEVYLIDEVLGVGDKRFQKKCRDAFRNRLSGSHIIMASHALPTLREYCDAAVVLHNGHLTYCEDLEEGIRIYDRLNEVPLRPVPTQ